MAGHVLLHWTEAQAQMKLPSDKPDVVTGSIGGWRNGAGLAFPYMADMIAGEKRRIIAVEPSSCLSPTTGENGYDFADTAKMTPLFKVHTLGCDFVPPGIHAGGFRYHRMAPRVSLAHPLRLVEAIWYRQVPAFEAAVQFARTEGVIPVPESPHAVRHAIDEALRAKEEGVERVNLFKPERTRMA